MVGTPYTIGAHVSAPATVRWTCTSRLRCPAAAAVVSKKKPRRLRAAVRTQNSGREKLRIKKNF